MSEDLRSELAIAAGLAAVVLLLNRPDPKVLESFGEPGLLVKMKVKSPSGS